MKNPFRPEYRELKRTEKEQIDVVKDRAMALLQTFPVGTRESAIATTKLEEAVMWAVKGMTA